MEILVKTGDVERHILFYKLTFYIMAKISILERFGLKPKTIVKHCKHCGRVLPANDFGKNSHFTSGCESWCKDCRSKYYKTKRKAHTMCSTQHFNMGVIYDVAREKRKALGLTQSDVATKANISLVTVCRFERGHNVSIDIANKIIKALGCKLVIIDNDENNKNK